MNSELVVVNRKARKIFNLDGARPIETAVIDKERRTSWHAAIPKEIQDLTSSYLHYGQHRMNRSNSVAPSSIEDIRYYGRWHGLGI